MFDGGKSAIVDAVEGEWGKTKNNPDLERIRYYIERYYPHIADDLQVINSGVLGFVDTDEALVREAIELIDKLYPLAPSFRMMEQLCFAFVLYKNKDIKTHELIYHYYTKKEFFHESGKDFFYRHGAAFNKALIERSKEIPSKIVRPNAFRRLWYRIKVHRFPKKLRSGLLKLLYALSLNKKGYHAAHAVAYWVQAMNRDFRRYDQNAYILFSKGEWPKEYACLASRKKREGLLKFIKERQVHSK